MKIYKNGKLIKNGEYVAIDSITENGTNEFLVDIREDGNKQSLRIDRNNANSRITLCTGDTFRIEDVVGDVFVKTWTNELWSSRSFSLSEDFLLKIREIEEAVYALRSVKDFITLV